MAVTTAAIFLTTRRIGSVAAIMCATQVLAGCFDGSLDPYRCDGSSGCDGGLVCRPVSSGESYCVAAEDSGPGGGTESGTDSGADSGADSGCLCDDGDPCNGIETCDGVGGCNAGTPVDCSGLDMGCMVGECNQADGMCMQVTAPDGTACDDGDACNTGEACATGACVGGAMLSCDDGAACTIDACDPALGCTATPDETLCANLANMCNADLYSGNPDGCGPPAVDLVLACGPGATPPATETCTFTLSTLAADPVTGEADRITCTAVPRPVLLFSDDFTGGWDAAAWTLAAGGSLDTSTDLSGNEAATATTSGTMAGDLPLSVTGLDTVCVDFDVAYEAGAGAGESIEWSYDLDTTPPGSFVTVFSMDMAELGMDRIMHTFNRSVCVPLGTANNVVLRLSLIQDDTKVYVDNVSVTGMPAVRTFAVGGGPDPFDDLMAWTGSAASGMAQVAMFPEFPGNVLFADTVDPDDDFTLDRNVNASGCDVLDVDLDFAKDATDANELLELLVSAGGFPFQTVFSIDFNATSWYPPDQLFPWFGLHRVTDLVPLATGASAVVFRLHLAASGGGTRYVFADDFVTWCADIPDPVVGPIADLGGGMYEFDVTSGVLADVTVTCSWQTLDDGPVADAAGVLFQ